MKVRGIVLAALALSFIYLAHSIVAAEELPKDVQDKVDAKVKEISAWAADPTLVKAVSEQNATPSDEVKAMTQDKWKSLNLLDPFVRSFTKNPAGAFLKSKKDDTVTEAF